MRGWSFLLLLPQPLITQVERSLDASANATLSCDAECSFLAPSQALSSNRFGALGQEKLRADRDGRVRVGWSRRSLWTVASTFYNPSVAAWSKRDLLLRLGYFR
ncbi:hypothetical protein CIHG_00795 [Coccidioides immitis H538.4]|uniref:Secreted protein n=2 Tax=Coccidioides immitis TaxID=5501 RepID=A0A0J8U7K8_COCIT|nr:hypothetical protein CIRG_03212 [Coccidioides immitis RMSCC 2394]KMU83013.1 hypothetical protein CIHG_00795 [Coccidioides immitis H538.4]